MDRCYLTCVCVCVHVYVYVYTHVRVYVYIYIYICVCCERRHHQANSPKQKERHATRQRGAQRPDKYL